MPYPATLDEIGAALTARGCPALARRLAYFASDADLEPGDVPLTLGSALGFWAFFRRVDSEGRVDLACSPEGRLSAVWRFADPERRACVWFNDDGSVDFAATYAPGRWVDIAGGGDTGSPDEVMAKLVEAGLLQWHQETQDPRNSQPGAMSPDTAGIATGPRTGR